MDGTVIADCNITLILTLLTNIHYITTFMYRLHTMVSKLNSDSCASPV